MPSGAKKRKAAKKKKVNDSSSTNPHQVIAEENEFGGISSPAALDPVVEVVKREDSSSEKKSTDVTNEEEGNVEIETVSKSKSVSSSSSSSSDSSDDESRVVEKEVVVIESIEPVPAVESESLQEEISPIVDPVKPVDSSVEEVSKVFDEMTSEENKDLVVEEVSQVVDDCLDSTVVAEPVLKEDEAERSQPLVEKTDSESKYDVSSSTPPKDLISDVNGADCANEVVTTEHSDRQVVPAASTPVAVQNTTSWKSCCGIFELFSGSGR